MLASVDAVGLVLRIVSGGDATISLRFTTERHSRPARHRYWGVSQPLVKFKGKRLRRASRALDLHQRLALLQPQRWWLRREFKLVPRSGQSVWGTD